MLINEMTPWLGLPRPTTVIVGPKAGVLVHVGLNERSGRSDGSQGAYVGEAAGAGGACRPRVVAAAAWLLLAGDTEPEKPWKRLRFALY